MPVRANAAPSHQVEFVRNSPPEAVHASHHKSTPMWHHHARYSLCGTVHQKHHGGSDSPRLSALTLQSIPVVA